MKMAILTQNDIFWAKVADIYYQQFESSLKCKFLRKEWIVFYNSTCDLLIIGSGLTICKNIYENIWFYMTWKLGDFVDPPSPQ